MDKSTKSKAGLGCMLLFLLPFLVVGIFALGKGIVTYLNEPQFTEDVIAMLGVGTMFTFISMVMLSLAFYGFRVAQEQEALEAAYPGQPWMWKPEWVDGRIGSNASLGAIVLWIFGISFTGFGIPILFAIWDEVSGNPAALLGLLFPLVGLGMLGGAVYSTLRWYKYGKVTCEMVTHPGVVGGWFKGIVWVNIQFGAHETVEAQLTCYHRYVTGSGKQQTTHRDVEWQEDIEVDMGRVQRVEGGETAIPIKTYIPRECKETTLEEPNDRIEWELTAKAEVAGIDFKSSFIVPVFVTDESVETAPLNEDGEPLDEIIQPYTPTIAVRELANGFTLYAAPRRNPGMMFGLTFFFAIWTVVVGFLFGSDEVTWLFPIVFGGFEVLIGWMVLWVWFGKSWLHVEKNEVTIRKEIFGIGKPKSIDLSTVVDVEPHINMRSGNTPYYTIRFMTGENAGMTTIGGLRSKDEAEDLCRRIRGVIGL